MQEGKTGTPRHARDDHLGARVQAVIPPGVGALLLRKGGAATTRRGGERDCFNAQRQVVGSPGGSACPAAAHLLLFLLFVLLLRLRLRRRGGLLLGALAGKGRKLLLLLVVALRVPPHGATRPPAWRRRRLVPLLLLVLLLHPAGHGVFNRKGVAQHSPLRRSSAARLSTTAGGWLPTPGCVAIAGACQRGAALGRASSAGFQPAADNHSRVHNRPGAARQLDTRATGSCIAACLPLRSSARWPDGGARQRLGWVGRSRCRRAAAAGGPPGRLGATTGTPPHLVSSGGFESGAVCHAGRFTGLCPLCFCRPAPRLWVVVPRRKVCCACCAALLRCPAASL